MNCHLKKSDDGKEKGKGSGRNAKGGKGNRKGKLYEVSEEQWNDDWWSHDWDWSEYDSNVYQVSGWEQWDEYSWTADDGWYGSSDTWKQEDSTEPVETPEKTVGSLVLSPVLCLKDSEEEIGNGLFLEEVSHSKIQFLEPVSNLNSCEVVQEDPISLGPNLFVCPQPFLGRFGLKHRGHDEFDGMSEKFHDGLVCGDQMRVKVAKQKKPTFLNHEGELSACHEWERFAPIVLPLLSEVGLKDDVGWWLLDSGAAVTVLAKHCFTCYGAEKIAEVDDAKFSAANGSSVKMHGKAEISVFMNLWHDGRKENSWKKAKLVAR